MGPKEPQNRLLFFLYCFPFCLASGRRPDLKVTLGSPQIQKCHLKCTILASKSLPNHKNTVSYFKMFYSRKSKKLTSREAIKSLTNHTKHKIVQVFYRHYKQITLNVKAGWSPSTAAGRRCAPLGYITSIETNES